jgi:hypothetical protein
MGGNILEEQKKYWMEILAHIGLVLDE